MTLIVCGCSTTKPNTETFNKDVKIKKVHKFIKEFSLRLDKQNFSSSSGIKGAMGTENKKLSAAQQGEEIIITWAYKNKIPLNNVILKMVYKTSKDESLKTITQVYPEVTKGTYKFNMDNSSSLFAKQGTLSLWRITIEQDDKILAVKESALWSDIKPWKEKAFKA